MKPFIFRTLNTVYKMQCNTSYTEYMNFNTCILYLRIETFKFIFFYKNWDAKIFLKNIWLLSVLLLHIMNNITEVVFENSNAYHTTEFLNYAPYE